MRRWHCVVVAAAAVAALGRAPDAAPQGKASPAGYDIDRSQSVQNAPAGRVGRKTTDRERRAGKEKETAGREVNYVLVFGGFARRCPTAEGIVEGDFEYALTYDEVVTAGGTTQQTHQARRLVARLRGHVGDDAKLERVEMEGEFTVERSGSAVPPSSERRPVRTSFRPGTSGEPDFEAMRTAVEATADIAVASVVLGAGTLYRQAETEWLKKNACVEFEFDPPTDERRLGPNQQTPVRVGLRTKEGKAYPVPFQTEHISVIGDVRSTFFRPSAGEITVDLLYDFRGFAGSACKQQAVKTFPIAGLPANLLRFMVLELAEDGRYKLSLGLPDRVWQVWSMEVESVCTFPGGQVSRDHARVNEVAVQLGVQQGKLNAEEGVVGALPAPIRRGPRTITGSWSFAKKTD
jgi:hypothetical protein